MNNGNILLTYSTIYTVCTSRILYRRNNPAIKS